MTEIDVIQPQSEEEVCDVVRDAAESGITFEVAGASTKMAFGRPAQAHAVLEMLPFSGIVKYEPEELVITVQAATPVAEIEETLAGCNQMLGFEPADWGPLLGGQAGVATIGGVASANACGSRRVKAGAVRDHVIGCRFVNGQGEAIKAGGPVIKNVTGFDIPRLMCGAFGTLGVLTELTLRVTPKPARTAAIVLSCAAEEGLRLLRIAARLPIEPTGLAYVPTDDPAGAGRVAIRVEGDEEPIRDKLRALQKEFGDPEMRIVDTDAANAIFLDLSDGQPFIGKDSDIWRLCVPTSAAYEAVTASGAETWYADWAGGLLWLGLPATAESAATLRAITAKHGGHATLMRASEEARAKLDVFEPEPPARAALTRSVKAAFDRNHVFNPGRMYKDI